MRIPFNNLFANLGEGFYQEITPAKVENPKLIIFNQSLADELGINTNGVNASGVDEQQLANYFSGNEIIEGSQPLAMAYAGHQFGYFNPQLGDGRAIHLGEVAIDDKRLDIQLKGSGRTRYSRDGDGKSALGPVLREYLVSEAMHQLGVPTTRALAAVTTGEEVARERLIPGGVITRVASSFVRVGTFQYFASQGQTDKVKTLSDYVIEKNYPELKNSEQPYHELLKAVTLRQASLIAKWMSLGFIHGVMNTDNMSVAGETIDYGPCAFMDYYQHQQVYSSIDRQSRYAYNKQPSIALWNLSRLAEALLPLLHDDVDKAVEIAQSLLEAYAPKYEEEWLSIMRGKCGLQQLDAIADSDDRTLLTDLLDVMHTNRADFTLTFYFLSSLGKTEADSDKVFTDLFDQPEQIKAWLVRWRERLVLQQDTDEERKARMLSVNPVYIPRNHLIEAVIRAAEDSGDFKPFHKLHAVLQNPFQLQAGDHEYHMPPRPEEEIQHTFCGT